MAQAQVQAISSATVNYETYANTNYNYSTTGGGSSYFPSGTVYNVRFNEGASNHMVLGKVTVGARSFDGVALAGQINIARATNAPIKGLHHIVLYEQLSNSGSNILLKSNYAATMEESLRTRLINHGADNVFSDQGDSNGNNNNIQRIDYMFPDGLPVHSHVEQRGFLVMDRGGNDRFKIAAVKSLDVNGKPASFGPVVSVLETNWGASGISLDTIVLRGYTASGDPQHPSADVDPQPLSGVFLNWQTLGLATNDLFYGYALAGNDSTTNGAYWTQTDNAAYFPTNTSPDSTYGGLDLISGGLMFFDEALNVTLGDRAWEDLNANGVQDVGEPGISNVLVHVFDAASNLAAILRTDTNGVWLSKGHGPGSYYAKYFLPGGYQFTARHVGTNAAADSDADLATGLTAAYAMTNGMTNLTLDAGLFRRAAIGDFAWEDLDGDGQQDAGEPGLSNVVVRLYDAAANVVGTTTSSATGAYAFTNLAPGTSYFLDFAPPPGNLFTVSNVGADGADSDPLPGTNRTAAIPLVSGQTNLAVDAGFYRPASVGDFAWEDLDGDGQQDAGEPGLSDVVVRLYDAASNVVGTTTSSATGAYAFTNLAPGIYSVGYALPAGYGGTQANAGNDATDSDADPATGRTAPFLLASGQADPTVDAGFARPATLGDKTWADADFDGQQDAGEPALANVVVTLYDAASNAVGTKTSTTAGAYAFTNLLPGIYYVDFAPPAGYQLTKANVGADATDSDPDPLTRRTGAIFLSGGLNNPTVDAGFVAPAALGDKTWVDSDYDGQQDAGEPALANVVVTLYDAASNVVGTKTSTAAGAYAFTNLPPGTYCVGFAPPADYQLTTIDAGADATDSDANPATGRTGPVALTNGQTDLTIDAGFYRPSSVSLKLWKSSALTNDWELGETNDYYLTLQNTGAVALAGVALADVLPPGVSFVAGSAQLVRLTAVSTDPFSETVADLFSTASYANNDGDSNWVGSWAEAGDNNSAASGSVLVRVAGATNALVFEGNNADNDYVTRTNALAPAPGRVYTNVTLGFAYQRQNWDAGDSFTLYVSTNGFAGQSNLVFSVPTTAGTDSGYVSVATNLASRMGATMALRLRAGGNFSNGDRINFDALVFTNQGYDVATNVQTVYGPGVTVAVVSNLAAATPTNLLANFTMAAGTTVTVRIRATLGAPLASTQLVNVAVATNPATPPLTATVTNCAAANAVGDRAWIDADADGLQDAGEAGLSGATVRLYDAGSNLLAATTTAVDGAYAFAYLPSGSYFLEFVVPAGYPTAPRDQGGDDALDSDADGATGRTATFALGGGTNDASRDAGFYQLAALGDHAWEDVDHDGQQDAGEPAIANVVVTLYNAASNALGIATSSASGAYAFANLMPGTYFVSFAPPAGYAFTAANVGDDATDSDPLAGTNRTAFFALASGQTNLTVDAGFNAALAIGDRVWFDSNRDGVQNAYETNGIADVPVAALDTNGVVRAETVTDADGHYRFGGLAGGTYLLRFDLAELNSITVISAVDVGDDDEADSDAICGNVGDYAWSGPVSIAPGQTNLSVDLGITTRGPTRAELAAIWGEWTDGQGRLAWRTSSEFGTAGFLVYRIDPETGAETRLNDRLLPSAFREDGATYGLVDPDAQAGSSATYRLEEIELSGETRNLGRHAVRFAAASRSKVAPVRECVVKSAVPRSAAPPVAGPSAVLKVRTTRDGLYAVDLAAIAAGMDRPIAELRAQAASGFLKLETQGTDVPWIYDASRDRLIFHGATPPPDWYVHESVYLISEGAGRPMARRAPGAAGGATVWPTTRRFEDNRFLFNMTRMPADFYFWAGVVSGFGDLSVQTFPLDLSGHAGGDVHLKVRLMGWSSSTNDPDHLARFAFNGAAVGELTFDDQNVAEAELAIPASAVKNGENALTVEGVLQDGRRESFFVVDWIEASFACDVAPVSGTLQGQVAGLAAVSAAAFAEPVAVALDAAGNPTWIADETGALPAKAWAVAAGDVRCAVAEASAVTALSPEPAAADAWFMAATNAIDYLVIAPRELAATAQTLADFRAAQGLRAGVAIFEDVCDLLAHGVRTPQAIPVLLRHAAATWTAAPRLVVLAGSGNYDYLGVQSGEKNWLPPLLIQTSGGVCASDGLLADLGGDARPDVALGRLPARTPEELAAMIAKIEAYEAGFGSAWQNELRLAADQTDSIGSFAADNARLAELVQAPHAVVARLDLDDTTIEPARAEFLDWFNVGAGFIHYAGHGGMKNLGAQNLLTWTDVAALANAERPPVVVTLTCLAARYEVPDADSMGEALLRRAGGGAVAVLGPSGLSRNAPATELGEAFYRAILLEGEGRLGLAFLKARRALPESLLSQETLAVYNLLGDPALRVAGNDPALAPLSAAQIALKELAQTYDGAPRRVAVATEPAGLAVQVAYEGNPEPPTAAGTYAVVARIATAGYEGSATGVLTVAKAPAVVTLENLAQVYDGASKQPTVATEPAGLSVEWTYNGSAAAPSEAGTYEVVATVADANHAGAATGVLTVAKAPAVVTLETLAQVYDGASKQPTVATEPAGLPVEWTYNGSAAAPSEAGTYEVVATVADANHAGAATGVLTVAKAPASVALGNLAQVYDGAPKQATASTAPAELTVDFTYDGRAAVPTAAGTYAVSAQVDDANWQGAASGRLTIAKADQTIAFPVVAPALATDVIALEATALSGLPVEFAVVSGPGTLRDGNRLAFGGPGTVVVAATQAGNANWNAAPVATQSLCAGTLTASAERVLVRENGEGRLFLRCVQAPATLMTVTVARVAGDANIVVQGGATRTFKASNGSTWQAVTFAAAADANAASETATFRISAPGEPDRFVEAATLDGEVGANLAAAANGAAIVGSKAYGAAQAIDGIHISSTNYAYTIWTNDPPGALTLDLQAAVAVARIRLLNWDWVQRSQRYRIEASLDGAVWTSLVDASEEDHQGWDDWEVDDVARYLRFTGLTNSAGSFAVVSELEVYGPQTWLEVSKDTVNVREGGEGRFFVRLTEAPASNVVVSVGRAAGSDGLMVRNGATRTFKASNWNVWQAVTLAAASDANGENETATFRISAAGQEERSVEAVALDGDVGQNLALTAAISGAKAGGAALAIDGSHEASTNYAYVVWTNDPPGSLTLDLLAPATVTRMRLLTWDWVQRLQRYRIEASLDGAAWTLLADSGAKGRHGWDDWPVDGRTIRYLRFTGLSNSANAYVCLAEWEVYGARAALAKPEVSKATVRVRENGEGRFFVRLPQAPKGTVKLSVSRVDGSEGFTVKGGAIRTFKASNWNAWQAVTLVAGDDDNAEGETATFCISAPGMEDAWVEAVALDDDLGANWALAAAGTTVSGTKAGLLAQLIDGIHDVAGNYGYVVWTNNPPGDFTLDLHAATAVSRIRLLNWDWVHRVHRYRIEGSLDGTSWTLLADAGAEDHHGWDDWPVADVAIRYLRFTGLANSANSSVCLAEMEVYGARVAVPRAAAAKTSDVEMAPFPITVVTSDDGSEHTNGWGAVDGDTNTLWQGRSGAGGWYIAVGYDAPVFMTNLVLDAEAVAPIAVRCLYSLDGDAWTELPERLAGEAIELNYLWLIFSGEGAVNGPTVREILPQE